MNGAELNSHLRYQLFIQAYLDFLMYRRKHAELANFYTQRYHAFSEIFAIDLGARPAESRVTGEVHLDDARAIYPGFESTAAFYVSISTPLSGYLETPVQLSKVAGPYEARFRALASQQEQLCLELMCRMAQAMYGPCRTSVEESTLEALGFGKSQAPDPFDYW
ncbi:MAG: hypothetical protein WDO69_09790 [Pseudomonadota bacterium]